MFTTSDQSTTVYMIQNASTTAVDGAEPPSHHPGFTSLNSSMTLAILIVLTALVFMGLLSVYSRCFSDNSPSSPSPTSSAAASSAQSNHPHPPLDPSTVKSLPLLSYDAAATPRLLEDCPICLTEFRGTESVKMIPYCGHVFHPGCIDTWLESQVSCPLCRSTRLLTVAEEV
ncbi:RING-H2 finger protein ATL57-like [Henckelia pumila]|uniref:RING-H2 finger protein ATL57-like n=1 Tax=Henckelia pumila TaxID=405737 RepID=UPI003C6E7A1D